LASHEEVVDAVASTAGAIGYADARVASRQVPRVKLLALAQGDAGRAMLPDNAAVARGDYPLVRTLDVVSRGPLQGEAKALLTFCLGRESRTLLDAAGFLPVEGDDRLAVRP
jgi:ABC-type phosphate transport system substrate-binding protein